VSVSITVDDTRRYARQSAVTDPGERRPALQGLPSAEPSRLRELVPGTFTVDDPAPERDIVFGIFIREITGRTARPV